MAMWEVSSGSSACLNKCATKLAASRLLFIAAAQQTAQNVNSQRRSLAAQRRKRDTYRGVDVPAGGNLSLFWAPSDRHDRRGRTGASGNAGTPDAGAPGPR